MTSLSFAIAVLAIMKACQAADVCTSDETCHVASKASAMLQVSANAHKFQDLGDKGRQSQVLTKEFTCSKPQSALVESHLEEARLCLPQDLPEKHLSALRKEKVQDKTKKTSEVQPAAFEYVKVADKTICRGATTPPQPSGGTFSAGWKQDGAGSGNDEWYYKSTLASLADCEALCDDVADWGCKYITFTTTILPGSCYVHRDCTNQDSGDASADKYTAYEKKAILVQAAGVDGASASLDAAGFKTVTSLCCPPEMEVFFGRLLASMSLDSCSKPHIQGLMHWFSCVPDMDFQYMIDVINNGNPCKYWTAAGAACPVLSAECEGTWCR